MSNQISLFRFTVGKDIYEIRLNVDPSMLSSLPPNASVEEKQKIISEIAGKHFKFSCEDLAPILAPTVSDPLKMDLSKFGKKENLTAFSNAVLSQSREIALRTLRKEPSLTAASSSKSPSIDIMDSLVNQWLDDADIKKSAGGDPSDPPCDQLLNKIDGLAQESLKLAKMQTLLNDFSKALKTPESICNLSLRDWLFMISLIKKCNPVLSTNDALFVLTEELEKNRNFTKSLDYLIALGTFNRGFPGSSPTLFKSSLLRPFFEESSQKDIRKYQEKLTDEEGLTRDFTDHSGLLAERISDNLGTFLEIVHKLLPKSPEEKQALKKFVTFNIKAPSGLKETWSPVTSNDFDPISSFQSDNFRSSFISLLNNFESYKENLKKYRSGKSTRQPFINIEDVRISGPRFEALFDGEKTAKEIHDDLYLQYLEKKEMVESFASLEDAREYIKTHFAEIKANIDRGKSYTLAINQIEFGNQALQAVVTKDACPSDEEIDSCLKAVLVAKYKRVIAALVADINRDAPISYKAQDGSQKSFDHLKEAIQKAESLVPKIDLDASETELAAHSDQLSNAQAQAIEKELGIQDLSLYQKYMALNLLFQATPAMASSLVMYKIFSKRTDLKPANGLPIGPIDELFFWNTHLEKEGDCFKVYFKYSYVPSLPIIKTIDKVDVMSKEYLDTLQDIMLIRTIDPTAGTIDNQINFDASAFTGSEQLLLTEIVSIAQPLGVRETNQHFLL